MTYRFTANGSYAATGKAVGSIVGVLSVFEWSIFDTEHSNACYCLLQGIPRCFTLFRTFLQGLRPGISLFRSWPRGAPANGFKIRVGFFVKIPNSHSHFSNSWNSTPFFFSRVTMRSASKATAYHAIKTMTLDMFVRDMYKLRSDIPCVAALHDFHHFQALLALELLQAAPLALSHFQKTTITKRYVLGRKLSARSNGQWLMNLCSWWMLMNADWCWWMQWIQWKLMTSCVETLKSRHFLLQGSISVGLFDFWAHTDGLWLLEGPVWLPNIWKVHSEDRMIQNHSITA